MSRVRALALLTALALVFVACSDDNGGDNELGLRKEGTLTVGSNIAYAPFESYEAGEKAVGFDVDLMREVAERLELEVRFVNNPSFDALIPSLVDGQYDVVISAMTINDERKKQINFSDPYFSADQSLAVNVEQTPDLDSADKLTTDMVIGVEKGTTGADYAQENFKDKVKEIRIFEDTQGSLGDLATGRVQAVVNDFPVSAFAAETQFKDVLKVVQRFETGENYGIGVAKESSELLDAVNEALDEIRADGTYDEIFAKWFGAEE